MHMHADTNVCTHTHTNAHSQKGYDGSVETISCVTFFIGKIP